MSEDQRCPACGGPLATRWEIPPWRIAACSGCGLGALHPQPSPQEIAALYADPEYYAAHGGSGMDLADIPTRGAASRMVRYFQRYRLAPLEAALSGRGSLLDVGCSGGTVLVAARWAGWGPVLGIEPSAVARRAARHRFGLPIVGTDLADAAVCPGSLDAVTMYHVLEHVPDPVATLRACAALLRPGGVVGVESPNFASLAARWRGRRYRLLLPPYHLWHYTPAALRRLFVNAGLEPVSVFTPYVPQGTAFVIDIQAALLRARDGVRRLTTSTPAPSTGAHDASTSTTGQEDGSAAPETPPVPRRRRFWVDRAFETLYWPTDRLASLLGMGVYVYGIARRPPR